jgi:hypothetical protein
MKNINNNSFKANFAKARAPTDGLQKCDKTVIEEEDEEADLTVVPEEVLAGESDMSIRATTVMMIQKKAVDRDTIQMVAKSTASAFAPLICVDDFDGLDDLSQGDGRPSIGGQGGQPRADSSVSRA